MMRPGSHIHDAARNHPLLVEDRKRYSCMDQFDRPAENENTKDDDWIGKLSVRLLVLLSRKVRRL